MRYLADENFPRREVEALRNAGCDVRWIKEDLAASPDEYVLSLAMKEGRVLLTFDKDFGELAFKKKLAASCGVVLFRVDPSDGSRISGVVLACDDWAGHLSVVESQKVRRKPVTG